MRYRIIVAPDAVKELRRLPAGERSRVQAAIALHLGHEPTKVSRSRIKRLRGLEQPEYRLRVDDVRVFYDVKEDEVQVLGVVTKSDAQGWLDREGTPSSQGGLGGDEG
jgi:mRNA interferase RelE/StbE